MTRQSVRAAAGRYTAVAVVLHWLMAIAIIWMLMLGLYMTSDSVPDKAAKIALFQLHKSVGIVLLWLIAVRIAWRLTHRAPELTGPYPKLERVLATLGHIALYILMVAMPLSGWIMVSSSAFGFPTILFNSGLEWPHVPGVAGNEQINDAAGATHYWLAWIFAITIAGHALAVVKHWLIDRENILVRMWFPTRCTAEKLLVIGALALATTVAQAKPYTLALATTVAQAKPYTVDYTKSKLAFSGTYADKPFTGEFKKFTAIIDFDVANPAASKIEAVIETASASTGDSTYDKTLPTADWFDVKAYPQTTFKANSVEAKGAGNYLAHGTLTLKGKALPQDLAFTLTPANASGLTTVSSTATLNRLDYGVGAKSDASGEWVGKEIKLMLTLKANPQ